MSKKYVILGANGQLGKALRGIFPEARALSREELDIANEAQVSVFDWSKYDTIINAAAYVNADDSETYEGRIKTWQVNAGGFVIWQMPPSITIRHLFIILQNMSLMVGIKTTLRMSHYLHYRYMAKRRRLQS